MAEHPLLGCHTGGYREGVQWFLAPSTARRSASHSPIADPIGHTATDGRRLFIATRSPTARRLTAYDLATGRASPFAGRRRTASRSGAGPTKHRSALRNGRLVAATRQRRPRAPPNRFTDSVGRVAMLASSPDGRSSRFSLRVPEPDAEGNFHGPLHRVSAITGRFRYVAQVWGG